MDYVFISGLTFTCIVEDAAEERKQMFFDLIDKVCVSFFPIRVNTLTAWRGAGVDVINKQMET